MTEPTTPTTPTTAPAVAASVAPPRRIFTATLIIGASGQGKTSLAKTFAEYLWETFHRVLLFYSCDGGAFPTVIQTKIQQGLIRPWRMRTRSGEGLAFETCNLASKGYWPRSINPETGECPPAVQLVPPITSVYQVSCEQGHLLKTVPSSSLAFVPTFCPECRVMNTAQMLRTVETVKQTKGFELVGGMFLDGLTSMCGWFMGDMDERRGAGLISGEKSALGGPIYSGSVKFGGNNRADYGFAQTRAYQIVHNSLSVPNLVEGPIFTGLPDEVTEGGGMLPFVGLKLAGSAMTADSLQWFGNALEARIIKSEDATTKDRQIRRLYLSEYVDSENRRHLLKNSGSGVLPRFIEDPPVDPDRPDKRHFFTGFNLGHFFRMLDKALQDELIEDTRAGLPGIASAPGDYGEASMVVEAGGGGAAGPAGPAVGIAPIVQPVVGSTPVAAAAAAVAPAVVAGGPPRMSKRRAAGAPAAAPVAIATTKEPATVPAPAAAPAAIPEPAAVVPAAPVVAAPAPVVQAPAPAAPTAGGPPRMGPPPPPGMRPPARAPGGGS